MKKKDHNRILIFGTGFGITQSLPFFPKDKIAAIIAPSNRPEQVKLIRAIAGNNKIDFLEQPAKKSNDITEFYTRIKNLQPDFIWCNSYSMLIPNEILSLADHHAINVHWSLLPLNQGPNPIQWSIIKGEKKTGVSFHFMEAEIDTGDIIYQDEINIAQDDTWVSVFNKLEKLSLEMHNKYIPNILSGNYERRKQDPSRITINKRLNTEYPVINFSKLSDKEIYDLIRAQIDPLSGAYIKTKENKKIHFKNIISLQEIAKLRIEFSN